MGEAPEWVRDAWIGTELPAVRPMELTMRSLGVLSGPNGLLAQIWAMTRGKSFRVSGYVINARIAVETLAESQPDAARWWRENTPRLINANRNFIFESAVCEPMSNQRLVKSA